MGYVNFLEGIILSPCFDFSKDVYEIPVKLIISCLEPMELSVEVREEEHVDHERPSLGREKSPSFESLEDFFFGFCFVTIFPPCWSIFLHFWSMFFGWDDFSASPNLFVGKEVVGGAKSRAATAAAIQDTGHRAVVWWTGFVEDKGGGGTDECSGQIRSLGALFMHFFVRH